MSSIPFPHRVIPLFSLSAFTLGLSEFVTIGLLTQISQNLALDLGTAGSLVASYAAGISLGAPVVTWITRRAGARRLCIALMGAFVLLNVAMALSVSLTGILLLRAAAGVVHGSFFSVASATVPELVPPEKSSMAIALMFSGLTLAMVAGVPAGIWIAESSGWQGVFLAIAGLALTCTWLMIRFLPPGFGPPRLDHSDVSMSPGVLSFYLVTVFGFGGGFVFYAFAEPWLSQVAGMNAQQLSLALALVGVGSLIGNLLGGILPSKIGLNAAAIAMLVLQSLSLLALAIFSGVVSSLLWLVLWAIAAFALAPMVQTAAVSDGQTGNPRLCASFNATAFNLGIALASQFGGVLAGRHGLETLPIAAALAVLLAVPVAAIRLAGRNRLEQAQLAAIVSTIPSTNREK